MSKPRARRKIAVSRKEEEVDLVGADGGEVTVVIKELDGPQRNQYMEMTARRVDRSSGPDNPVVSDFDDFGIDLLAMCMYKDGHLVKADEIKAFSSSALTELFDIATELSGLNKKGADKLKKG